ncbi:hypothetical protein [Arthrobacter sp. ISL-28]|uniref:hypothetical protein n=1 Tax=Arthrobacter sp. ISL-28 TaxID=2819108 RepID=UPI001BE7581D|nr:hypothetical protein [Arthrobacter sp. ISL-28]MBT2519894.1 hypothetical protein [Arthrobacter sp. ISL-28]
MTAEKLHPTPHSWWEKAYDVAGIGVGLPIAAAIIPLLEKVGLWVFLEIVFVATLAIYFALTLLVAPLRRQRAAKDAQFGIVECSIRPGPKSLPPGFSPPAASDKRGWIFGYAKVEEGSLIFQPRNAFTGSTIGEPVMLADVTPMTGGLRTPAVAPWYLGRGHTVVYVKTDRGVIEVGGSIAGLKAAGIYPADEQKDRL